MYDIDIKVALYFIVISVGFRDTWQNGLFYIQQIEYNSLFNVFKNHFSVEMTFQILIDRKVSR